MTGDVSIIFFLDQILACLTFLWMELYRMMVMEARKQLRHYGFLSMLKAHLAYHSSVNLTFLQT